MLQSMQFVLLVPVQRWCDEVISVAIVLLCGCGSCAPVYKRACSRLVERQPVNVIQGLLNDNQWLG